MTLIKHGHRTTVAATETPRLKKNNTQRHCMLSSEPLTSLNVQQSCHPWSYKKGLVQRTFFFLFFSFSFLTMITVTRYQTNTYCGHREHTVPTAAEQTGTNYSLKQCQNSISFTTFETTCMNSQDRTTPNYLVKQSLDNLEHNVLDNLEQRPAELV